ncbi:T9SS type A sorting domain-containing protein [Flavobacterium buctense]|uniref:T9SS type A sorting domain-containing protein n=1 Tax=Flavobacterium buctense TaxID=1648146 RepID=A0ABU9DYS3_9FLAO|nr:T9SS type A sorting domain-containing protein [Flavobacterium buctense]
MKKITKLLAVTLLLFSSSNALSQYSLDWEQNAGSEAKTSQMSAVDSQDNIVVTGHAATSSIYTRKYNISGTLLWETTDSSGINSVYEKSNWVSCDADNNVFVVGNQYAYSASIERDYPQAIVALKYSPTGTLLWKTVIPISILITNQISFDCRSVVDASGNLYIGTSINNGATLIKLDTGGTVVFTNSSTANSPINFNGMRLRNNKIAVVTSSPNPNVAPVFVWDTSGTLLWTANAVGLIAADVEMDENENVYVLCSIYYQVNPITWDYDARLVKYSPTGSLLWSYNYDFGGYNFVTRMTYANNRISAIGYGNSAGLKWQTFQTDTNGTLLWSSPYIESAPVTVSDSYPKYVIAKPTGEVIVTGVGGPTPNPSFPSTNQMPIVQYSNTGVQNWVSTPNIYAGTGLATAFASDGSLYAIGSRNMYVFHYDSTQLSTNDTSVFTKTIVSPNPFNDKITITANEMNLPSKATIFDMTGKELLSVTLLTSSNEVELSSLKSGIYFCQLISNKGIETVKMVKR